MLKGFIWLVVIAIVIGAVFGIVRGIITFQRSQPQHYLAESEYAGVRVIGHMTKGMVVNDNPDSVSVRCVNLNHHGDGTRWTKVLAPGEQFPVHVHASDVFHIENKNGMNIGFIRPKANGQMKDPDR
jgi:hypothetical protein